MSIRPLRKVHPRRGSESRTVQSEAPACDINLMMKRYQNHGTVIPGREGAFYADFTNVDDYLSARDTIAEGESGFASLPSDVRSRFGNDPAELIEWVGDGRNREEAVELGLLPKPEPEGGSVENTVPPVAPTTED